MKHADTQTDPPKKEIAKPQQVREVIKEVIREIPVEKVVEKWGKKKPTAVRTT